MSKGFRWSTVPMSMFTYVDHTDTLDKVQEALDGKINADIIKSMEYPSKDGEETRLKKTAALFEISTTAILSSTVWTDDALNGHFLSFVRDNAVPKFYTLWKPLSFTVGKGFDELFVPKHEVSESRESIARIIAKRFGTDPNVLIEEWSELTEDQLMDHINNSNIEVIGFGVPMIPGFHTLHTLRVWEHNSIGVHPRVAMSFKRDTDGDLFCCVIPQE
jgi:hypothetical protein